MSLCVQRPWIQRLPTNKVGELQLLGYYKSDQILEAVRKGNIPVTLVIDTEQMGRYCVQALEEYLQEGHANSYYSVDLQFVTKENVD
jgi:ribose transport system substrate-binding protein